MGLWDLFGISDIYNGPRPKLHQVVTLTTGTKSFFYELNLFLFFRINFSLTCTVLVFPFGDTSLCSFINLQAWLLTLMLFLSPYAGVTDDLWRFSLYDPLLWHQSATMALLCIIYRWFVCSCALGYDKNSSYKCILHYSGSKHVSAIYSW